MKPVLRHILVTAIFLFGTATTSFAQFTCGDTLVDTRDGKKYTTVLIGSQCWMKQSLNYGVFTISVSTATTHTDMKNNGVVEKYCYFNDSTKCALYGGLYEWNELMNYTTAEGGQGICPNGWHLPTDAEWTTLVVFAKQNSNNLKAVTEGSGSGKGNNSSGFSALHSGDRDAFGIFYGQTRRSIFWTSKAMSTEMAWHYTLRAEDTVIEHLTTQKITGFACRCIKNTTSTGVRGNEKHEETEFTLFPNPSAENLVLIFSGNVGAQRLKVINTLGQVVLEHDVAAGMGEININLTGLSAGVYVVKISRDGAETFASKYFVKQ